MLYINFKKPSRATESEMTDDDILVRYEGEEVVGLPTLRTAPGRVIKSHANLAFPRLRLTRATRHGDANPQIC